MADSIVHTFACSLSKQKMWLKYLPFLCLLSHTINQPVNQPISVYTRDHDHLLCWVHARVHTHTHTHTHTPTNLEPTGKQWESQLHSSTGNSKRKMWALWAKKAPWVHYFLPLPAENDRFLTDPFHSVLTEISNLWVSMPASCSEFTYPLTFFSRWTLGALYPQGALQGKKNTY